MKKYSIGNSVSLIEEPSVYYALNNPYDRIAGVFGGYGAMGQVVNSDIDLISVSRKGLPKSVLAAVSSVLNISMEILSDFLHVSHRTLQRKKDDDLLSVNVTEHLLEMARVISHGLQVFDTLEDFKLWLHQEIRALDYKTPISFFDTSLGLDLVGTILGRIEHGVFS